MNIPLVDLKMQYGPLKEEILSNMSDVLDSMYLFLGKNVQALEKEFAEFCKVKHGIGVGSGTDALHVALRAMDIGYGDEVITVSHTFIATTEAIMLVGAVPVFVDIDPVTCLMDVSQIEDKITDKTKAILPVHLYGQTVDMDPLLEIARKHDLKVIEDACQAHGAEYKGRRAGSMGDAGAFSFYFSKNLGGYGEGGFVTTNDDDLAKKVRMIRDHGSQEKYYHHVVGMNARLDELQAVVLRAKLPYLEAWNEQRRAHAKKLKSLLAETSVAAPTELEGNRHVYHLYVVRTQHRDDLMQWLRDHNVFPGIHYPVPIHLQPAVASLGYKEGDLPVTEQVVKEILSLPIYAELTDEQIEYMVGMIKKFESELTPA